MKIAVFCPNWVGDLVMATPTLRAVREHYHQAHITAVVRPYVADVLAGLDLVDDVLVHNPFGNVPADRGLGFARRLRNQHFDVAVLLPNSFRSALWARISGAKRRIGINRNGRWLLLTDAVKAKPRKPPHPVIDEYLRIAEHLGCTQLSHQMELATTPDDERQLEAFWKRQRTGTAAGNGIICLNPGGAFGGSKHWPVASFAELARRVASELGHRVLVLCGPAERAQAREIVRLADHRAVVSLADDNPTIGLTKAAIRNSDLLVTTDSGPRHFAPPFNVPVISLFGPTHIAWSETFYERGLHLQLDLDCGPCQQRTCPLKHHRCMKDLTVQWVYKAVVSMLERYPSRTAA